MVSATSAHSNEETWSRLRALHETLKTGGSLETFTRRRSVIRDFGNLLNVPSSLREPRYFQAGIPASATVCTQL